MGEFTKSDIEWRSTDWRVLDSHHQAGEYLAIGGGKNIYKGIIYTFFGPPVKRLFPSASNLNEVIMPGIYFTGKHFLRVMHNKGEGFTAEFIKANIPNIRQVSFCVTFSPAYNHKNWVYFGSGLTHDIAQTMYGQIANLKNLSDETEGGSYSWLGDLVTIRNLEEAEETHIAARNSRPSVSVDENQFFDALEFGIDGDNQAILNIIVGGQFCPFTLSKIRSFISSQNIKGKGGKKGWPLPRGLTPGDMPAVSHGLHKGKGYGQAGESRDHPLLRLSQNNLMIIQDTNIYQFNNGQLSLMNALDEPDSLTTYARQLGVVEAVIRSKIKLLKESIRSAKREDRESRSSRQRPNRTRRSTKVETSSESSDSSEDDDICDQAKPSQRKSSTSSGSDKESSGTDKFERSKPSRKVKSDKSPSNTKDEPKNKNKKEKKDKKLKPNRKDKSSEESSNEDNEPKPQKKKNKKLKEKKKK